MSIHFIEIKLYPNAQKFTYNYHLNNIIHMRLTSLEIPNVDYVFTTEKNNKTFKITVGFVTETIVLDDGNYSSIFNKFNY